MYFYYVVVYTPLLMSEIKNFTLLRKKVLNEEISTNLVLFDSMSSQCF